MNAITTWKTQNVDLKAVDGKWKKWMDKA